MSITPEVRRFILDRDRRCKLCGEGPPNRKLHVDHIIPKSRGGSDEGDNLRALCAPCNLAKWAKPPADDETPDEPNPSAHPMVGYYCHKTWAPEPGETFRGWMWQYQARVKAVCDGFALLQYFSAFDGEPTKIQPIKMTDLLDGQWVFYDNHQDWREAGDRSQIAMFEHDDRQFRRKVTP